jgi:hypothetical protein
LKVDSLSTKSLQVPQGAVWFNTEPKADFHVGLNVVLPNAATTRGNVLPITLRFVLCVIN